MIILIIFLLHRTIRLVQKLHQSFMIQVVCSPMEKTVNIPAVNIVLTRPVIDFMEFVSLVVKLDTLDKSVSKVFIHVFGYWPEMCFLIFFRIHTTDQHYLCQHMKLCYVLFLEYPSSSCLSTLSSGFTGASISACVLITTAVVIFMIR